MAFLGATFARKLMKWMSLITRPVAQGEISLIAILISLIRIPENAVERKVKKLNGESRDKGVGDPGVDLER